MGPEPANDSLMVNGLGGVDTITAGPGIATLIMLTINQRGSPSSSVWKEVRRRRPSPPPARKDEAGERGATESGHAFSHKGKECLATRGDYGPQNPPQPYSSSFGASMRSIRDLQATRWASDAKSSLPVATV